MIVNLNNQKCYKMSRIRADKFVNNAANGAPQLTYGAEVVVGVGLTGAGGINITGVATAASFSGNLTGNATGLTGTPNIDCGTGSFTGDVDIADKIVHTGDTNTAIRFPAADTFAVETAGSERVRIDSSGNGNFGAEKAVALPSGTGIQVYNSSSPRIKLVNDTTGNASGDGSYLYVSGSDFLIENKESANMRFYTSATEQLRIDSAGKVGININNPGSYNSAGNELVLGNTGNNGGMTIVSGTGNNGHIFFADGTSAPNQGIIKYEHANDQMAFNIATAEKLRITSAGITVTGTVTDSSGDLRITPILGKSSDYTLVVTDTGKTIVRTGGNITVPSSMTAGMIVTIINNANSTTTITAGATLRFTDSTTGNRTLAAYGVATVTYISASSAYITGTGLS